jgi:hypothetical protein
VKRRPHRDPVTPELREEVMRRDDWRCIAPFIEREWGCCADIGRCKSRWGERAEVIEGLYDRSALTLDHVKDEPRAGKRAPSDRRHLVTVCAFHHLDSGWATSHRNALRWYLRGVEAAA